MAAPEERDREIERLREIVDRLSVEGLGVAASHEFELH